MGDVGVVVVELKFVIIKVIYDSPLVGNLAHIGGW